MPDIDLLSGLLRRVAKERWLREEFLSDPATVLEREAGVTADVASAATIQITPDGPVLAIGNASWTVPDEVRVPEVTNTELDSTLWLVPKTGVLTGATNRCCSAGGCCSIQPPYTTRCRDGVRKPDNRRSEAQQSPL